MDLVYSKFGTLYDLIPNAPYPSNDPSIPALNSHVNGMVGSFKTWSATQLTRKQGHPSLAAYSPQVVASTKSTPSPAQSSKVNVAQSTSSQQLGDKKMNKGKSNKSSHQ